MGNLHALAGAEGATPSSQGALLGRCHELAAALRAAQGCVGLLRQDAEAAAFQISILEAEKAALLAK